MFLIRSTIELHIMIETERALGIHSLPKPDQSFSLDAEIAKRVKHLGGNQYEVDSGKSPPLRGYPKDSSYSVIEESIEVEHWHALSKVATEAMNIKEARLETFLTWVNECFNPTLVYYPYSGSHITPRETFGNDKVVHLSTDKCHPHLYELGSGQRVKGDASQLSFKEHQFDAAFIRTWGLDLDPKEVSEAVNDICLALKQSGLILVEFRQAKGNWRFKQERKAEKRLLKYLQDNFEQVNERAEVARSVDREEDLIFLKKLKMEPNDFYVFRNSRKPKKRNWPLRLFN